MSETKGARVKRLREGMGMTQSQLALGSNLDIKTIRSLEERGESEIQSSTIIKLARTLRVSTDYILLGVEGEENPVVIVSPESMLDSDIDEFVYASEDKLIYIKSKGGK